MIVRVVFEQCRRAVDQFRRDRSGQVLVLFLLALTFILIPAIGLGIDGSRAFEERRAAQTAVDQAAIAATRAACVTGGGDPVAKGTAAAARNGYNNGGLAAETGNTVAIFQPDATKPFMYTATINARIPGTFARMIPGGLFNMFHVTVEATADGANCGTSAGGGPGTGPIYAGGASCPGGSLNNIEISGNLHQVTGQTHSNGNFKNGGSGSTFNAYPDPAVTYVGTFEGGSNTYTAAPLQIAAPTPAWPSGWGPTDMPAWTSTEPFWKAYRDIRVNTGSVTSSSLNITSDGVWYTEVDGTLDVTGITAGVSIVIVSARGPIKLPTDLTTSNLVGRNFTPYNNASLPRQNVIIMSGFSDSQPCDQFAIEKSGESGTFRGIFWAPKAMVRWSGNKATLHGCVISHAFQMNGNEHVLNADATLCSSTSGATSPEVTLVK